MILEQGQFGEISSLYQVLKKLWHQIALPTFARWLELESILAVLTGSVMISQRTDVFFYLL